MLLMPAMTCSKKRGGPEDRSSGLPEAVPGALRWQAHARHRDWCGAWSRDEWREYNEWQTIARQIIFLK